MELRAPNPRYWLAHGDSFLIPNLKQLYIVSTTFVVEPSAHGQWYEFFTEKFIPSLAQRKYVLTRVLNNSGDAHYTYSLQIDARDIADYQDIESNVIGSCVDFCRELFGERILHFTTLLKKIEL